MKPKRVYLVVIDGHLKAVRKIPPGVKVIEKVLPEIFFADLVFLGVNSGQTISLVSPEGREKYDALHKREDEIWETESDAEIHAWCSAWTSYHINYLEYTISYKNVNKVISNMVNGRISGWWKWVFSGGVGTIKYLGDSPNE